MRNPKYLEKQMNRLSRVHDSILSDLKPFPEPDEYGRIVIRYADLKDLIRQRERLCFVDGFFFGVSCAS